MTDLFIIEQYALETSDEKCSFEDQQTTRRSNILISHSLTDFRAKERLPPLSERLEQANIVCM